ncbi:class I SAM-dependent methyltransferase [Anaeroselena agilis]|uniref:Class I SAM-dependent methyltransferase n=1 Tax=Anaeroselena agilis TaxID=3063788 RepID=A0ABU3NU64_9FIRM|nr:class I SAM-dependent methyltransferase [Selenomonadales bacterium 4137-cl]
MNDIKGHYEAHYSQGYLGKARGRHCYPVEFVVRTFLGTSYPALKLDRDYQGKRVLDLGCGDGRNIPMLWNCGLEVYGVEITATICRSVEERMKTVFGIGCEIKPGTNARIPFPDNYFDYILACHSLYYVEDNTIFADNLNEFARVAKSGGYCVVSLPDPRGTMLQGAVPCGEGHYRISSDPLSLRNGSQFRVFESTEEICRVFAPFFEDFSIGHCAEDYYGFFQSMWIVCMKRKGR